MSSSEPESSPEVQSGGQRNLAAIVFTDTVGFSAKMNQDEEHTLQLVSRDLDYMRASCEAFGGQVLKSTGDGLLMLFNSAVQAVACSLEIQRGFHKRNLEADKADVLTHRIGIHLGDVFQHDGDVMGDGVNIAARLQAQAVPGGICLSNLVFEVVNNRLPFYVNDLGARKLKNIGRVTAYQISPMETQPGGIRIGWYRYRPWAWRAFWLVIILSLIALAYFVGVNQLKKQRARKAAQMHSSTASPSTNTNFNVVAPAPVSTNPAPVSSTVALPSKPSLEVATQAQFDLAEYNNMRRYDFEGMQNWISTHDWPGKNTSQLNETCRQLKHLFNWAYGELNKHSASNPLVVVNKAKTISFWPAPFDGITIKNEEQQRTVPRGQVAPLAMVAVISQSIKEVNFGDPEQKAELQKELQLFIRTYQIKLPAKTAPPTTPTSNP